MKRENESACSQTSQTILSFSIDFSLQQIHFVINTNNKCKIILDRGHEVYKLGCDYAGERVDLVRI